MENLSRDRNGEAIQAAVRKKKYQQVPFVLISPATKVIRLKGTLGAGELDLRGVLGIIIKTALGAITAYYDSDTTKTWSWPGNTEIIFPVDPAASSLTITCTDLIVEVGGF